MIVNLRNLSGSQIKMVREQSESIDLQAFESRIYRFPYTSTVRSLGATLYFGMTMDSRDLVEPMKDSIRSQSARLKQASNSEIIKVRDN